MGGSSGSGCVGLNFLVTDLTERQIEVRKHLEHFLVCQRNDYKDTLTTVIAEFLYEQHAQLFAKTLRAQGRG